MRFGYVLLGLVALTFLQLSSGQQCSNGIAGVQNENICCDAACGTCGGRGCRGRSGGESNCCVGAITSSGMMCSDTQEAPCIINNDDMCTNGLPGTQNGEICCDANCVTCGGFDCNQRVGGPSNCCSGRIRESGQMCSDTQAAPCIVDDDVFCSNGVNGVEGDGMCCESQCGTCGGFKCRNRPGGKDACCSNVIEASGVFCDDTMMSPCII